MGMSGVIVRGIGVLGFLSIRVIPFLSMRHIGLFIV